ncbi:MAG: DNA repair protein RecO [Proteobacteria bacterium]|nr:DNA repair protein RecO [Pseudomonadota bacterium]
MTRASGVSAIVLHTRPYRETSLLVNLLTADYGRIAGVANGVRKGTRGHCFHPFFHLSVGFSGRSGLVTLTSFEALATRWLRGDSVAAAFYVCELITRLTREREPMPRLFDVTQWTLDQLLADHDIVPGLRVFERVLLEELGYGLDFDRDAQGLPLKPDLIYRFVPDVGFMVVETENHEEAVPGNTLLDIGANQYTRAATRRAALSVFRLAIKAHLGDAPLISRQMLHTASGQID